MIQYAGTDIQRNFWFLWLKSFRSVLILLHRGMSDYWGHHGSTRAELYQGDKKSLVLKDPSKIISYNHFPDEETDIDVR